MRAVLAAVDNKDARARLQQFIRAVLEEKSATEEVLMSRSVITRFLEDADERFEEVKNKYNDAAVTMIRDYGKGTISGKVGFFVTGIKSCLDA